MLSCGGLRTGSFSREVHRLTLRDKVRLCRVRGAVDSHSGHDSVTFDRNSRKQSSENIAAVSSIGSSSPPGEAHRPAQAVALYGGSKQLKFNVFVAVAALIKGAIHNTGVIEGDKPINSQRGRLTCGLK